MDKTMSQRLSIAGIVFLLLHCLPLYCLAGIKYHFFCFYSIFPNCLIVYMFAAVCFTGCIHFLWSKNIDDFGNPSFISGPLNLTTFSQLSLPINQLTSD